MCWCSNGVLLFWCGCVGVLLFWCVCFVVTMLVFCRSGVDVPMVFRCSDAGVLSF